MSSLLQALRTGSATTVLCKFNCNEACQYQKQSARRKTMATNERMNSIKQTAVIEGDTHMNTNRQTATIEGDTMTAPKRTKRIVSADQRRAEIMMLGIAATLLLIPLSQEFLKAAAPQNSWFLSIGDVLWQAKFLGLTGLSCPLLGLGGVLFTWMLF